MATATATAGLGPAARETLQQESAGASDGHQGSDDVPTVQTGERLWARPANALYVPKASCKYFCPTSFRYSSIALVASVFSLKMRCSFSPQRSTSDIIRSVKKSWKAKPMVGHHTLTLVPQSCSSPAPRGPTFVRHPRDWRCCR